MAKFTIAWAADCDNGLQIVRFDSDEDCCTASRRADGVCLHGYGGSQRAGEYRYSLSACRLGLERLEEAQQ